MSFPAPSHTDTRPAVQLLWLPAELGQLSSSGFSGPSGVQCPHSPPLVPCQLRWASQDLCGVFKHNLYVSMLCCVCPVTQLSEVIESCILSTSKEPHSALQTPVRTSALNRGWHSNWLKPLGNLPSNDSSVYDLMEVFPLGDDQNLANGYSAWTSFFAGKNTPVQIKPKTISGILTCQWEMWHLHTK